MFTFVRGSVVKGVAVVVLVGYLCGSSGFLQRASVRVCELLEGCRASDWWVFRVLLMKECSLWLSVSSFQTLRPVHGNISML
jgi:hypothetical protein